MKRFRTTTLRLLFAACLAVCLPVLSSVRAQVDASPAADASTESPVIAPVAVAPVSAVAVPFDATDLQQMFAGIESRHPGSVGNLELERRVDARFAASGFAHGEIKFEAPIFRPGKTSLRQDALGEIALLPMHPSLVRPGNFAENEFDSSLVYLGRGTVEDLERLNGVALDGVIGVMDFDSGTNWQTFLRFGVRGFIFLGQADYRQSEAVAKVYNSEVSVPRFLVEPVDAARLKDHLLANAETRVHLSAEPSRWENGWLRDLWVFVPGADTDGLGRNVLTVVAPMDANSVVPERASGGADALNLYLLLHMLDEYKAKPPASSFLLVATNAHTQGFRGDQMLAWSLLESDGEAQRIRNEMTASIRAAQLRSDYLRKLKLDGYDIDPATEKLLSDLRSLVDDSLGPKISLKEPLVNLARRDVNQVKSLKSRVKGEKLDEAAEAARYAELDEEYRRYVSVLVVFNKVGIKKQLHELTNDERDVLRTYVNTVLATGEDSARLNERDRELLTANRAIRDALGGRAVRLVMTLDVTWDGDRLGFDAMNPFVNNVEWSVRFGANSVRVARTLAAGDVDPFVDTLTSLGGLLPGHYFPDRESALQFYQGTQATPAVSLRNCYTDGARRFTPADTIDQYSSERVARILDWVPAYFRALAADVQIMRNSELTLPRQQTPTYSPRIETFKFDEFSASTVPNLPVGDSAMILTQRSFTPVSAIVAGSVMNTSFQLGDARAIRYFFTMNYGQDTAAYHFDADFRTIDHTIDAGDAEGKTTSNVEPNERFRTVPMFECHEVPILELNDSSLIGDASLRIKRVNLLDGARNSSPTKFASTGIPTQSGKRVPLSSGPAAVFVERNVPVKLITESKRLLVNASAEHPEGAGYSLAEPIGDDAFGAIAGDMQTLNDWRLGRMRGVTNELASAFRQQGAESIEAMEVARAKRDHVGYLRNLYLGLGSQVKAYEQVSSMTGDMLQAIIWYMALLLPFCFFVQKLLFKFVRIEAQMVAFAVLFVATFGIFRVIHPAFRVAQAPEAILIAFVMLVLGSFVILILHGRFEGEMKLLFQTYSGVNTSDVGIGAVVQKAMLIGVNNMKRRRTRTALTTATIVLVTFAMLAFSSVSKNMSPTFVPRSKDARYTGIVFHRNGNQCLDEATVRVLSELFAQDCARFVVRRWLIPPVSSRGETYPFALSTPGTAGNAAVDGNVANIAAVLGLSMADRDFLLKEGLPFIGPTSAYFSDDAAAEAIIPASLAASLGLGIDDVGRANLIFRGQALRLVGILNDDRFRAIQDINQRPILPIKAVQSNGMGDNASSSAGSGDEEDSDVGVSYAGTNELLLLPVETAKTFGALPYSVSIQLRPDQSVWGAINRMLTATKAKFYVSSMSAFKLNDGDKSGVQAGTYYVGSGYKTEVGGLARLLIPLLIAGTIILNTMLGAVYERKYEIAVYNAIGLNPTHIMLFFLAEALVYSVIGSVGGYLVGQVLALVLTKFHLVAGLNLNFSSLMVVGVILFTIFVVLLSTLYPAWVATRSAVPSGKRKWSIPGHDGKQMRIVMPFIYQPNLVMGIVEYLDDYFSRFTEASIGEMIARRDLKVRSTDAQGRPVYTLRYNLALAPYDLGVTQNVDFEAAFNEKVNSYQMVLVNHRLSGQDANWVTTNRPFLERLRKHMMHWRNLDIANQNVYVERARADFDGGSAGDASAPGPASDDSKPSKTSSPPPPDSPGSAAPDMMPETNPLPAPPASGGADMKI